jgi:hypothetical protein
VYKRCKISAKLMAARLRASDTPHCHFSPRIGAQSIFHAPIEDADILPEAEPRRVMVCCKTVRALMVQCFVQRQHTNHRAQAPDWHIKLAYQLANQTGIRLAMVFIIYIYNKGC